MTKKPREYNISAIRDLLLAAFSAETLVRFCQDRSAFRPVLNEIGPGHGLADMVDEIVTFCQKQRLWDDLLREVEQENPRQFAAFQDCLYVEEPASVLAPRPARAKTRLPWEPPRPVWFWPAAGGVAVVLVVILTLAFWPRPPDQPGTPTSTSPPATGEPTDPPEEVAVVPNVRGQNCERAEEGLESANLILRGRLWEVDSGIAYDVAIRTEPASGTEVQPGTEVALVCSLGPMTAVPDVTEQDWESAQQWMTDCCVPSFETRLEYETASTPAEVGHVISTDPPGGELVELGSLVTLIIGVEPAEVEVPHVANLTVEEASAQLAASYLMVGEIVSQTSEMVRTDRVIGCDPPSGELVEAGSEVVLVVSRGPEAVLVPDLIDSTWEAAQAELERLGLQAVKSDERYDDDIAAGRVIETDPYARKSVVAGSEVAVVVSLGLDPVGDRDGDGMTNSWEEKFGTDPRVVDAEADPDSDGMSNLDEYRNQTDPLGADFPSIRVVLRHVGERFVSVSNAIPSFEIYPAPEGLGTAYDAQSSEFTVYNAPAGEYQIHAKIDVDGDGWPHAGDFNSEYMTLEVSGGDETVRDYMDVYEVIHLTEPVDNASTLQRYDRYTFDLYDRDELFISWDALGGTTSYQVVIREYQYTPEERYLSTVVSVDTEDTRYRPDLPPSPAGRYYMLLISANRSGLAGDLWVEYSGWPGYERRYVFRVQ